jgi:hypothetical protein
MDIGMQPTDHTENPDVTQARSQRGDEAAAADDKPTADVNLMIAALHQLEPGTVFERDQPAMQERVVLVPAVPSAAAASDLAIPTRLLKHRS